MVSVVVSVWLVLAAITPIPASCAMARLIPEERTITNSVGMNMILVPAGGFIMLPGYDQGHPVRITRPFYIGVTEVTQRQFTMLTGRNPSVFQGEDLPVDSVSWYEAMEFCRLLSEKEGVTYRLPTEAEWEYTARAGSRGAYPWGDAFDPAFAWYGDNSHSTSHAVATRQPAPGGMYDLIGNLWEWCADWHDDFPALGAPAIDPVGPQSGKWKVIRGGSWQESPENSTLAQRGRSEPHAASFVTGFRVVREMR